MPFTFPPSERLKSEKAIGQLFAAGGPSFLAYPIRVVVAPLRIASESPVQVLIAVPKKNFKKAVHRNRIKRLVREAWRLNKQIFLDKRSTEAPPIALMLMYIAKEELGFSEVENGIKKAINKLLQTTIAQE